MNPHGSFKNLKVGDRVTRVMAGSTPVQLVVTELSDRLIHCQPWYFDRETGKEVEYSPGSSYLVIPGAPGVGSRETDAENAAATEGGNPPDTSGSVDRFAVKPVTFLRYYAELTEKVQRFGHVEQRCRWVAFTSLAAWPEALVRHVDASQVVSLRFSENYRKPEGIEAELIQ